MAKLDYFVDVITGDGELNEGIVWEAVQSAAQSGETSGAIAWGWNSGANDNLTDGSGNLTSYGQEVAQWMASMPAPSGSGPSVSYWLK